MLNREALPMNYSLRNRVPPAPQTSMQKSLFSAPQPPAAHQSMSLRQAESPKLRKISRSSFQTEFVEDEWSQLASKNHKDLGLDMWMPRWLEASEKFVFYQLIPEAVEGVHQALHVCNDHLYLHFKKTLHEFQAFQKPQTEAQTITLSDLVCYQQTIQQKGTL